jgi:hypothetical protein
VADVGAHRFCGGVTALVSEGAGQGFMVRDATENQNSEQRFTSREGAQNRPQLVIVLR